MKQDDYRRGIHKMLTQSTTDTSSDSNSYFSTSQLSPFGLKLYNSIRGLMDGVSSVGAVVC